MKKIKYYLYTSLWIGFLFFGNTDNALGFCGVSVETLTATNITQNSVTLEGRFNGFFGSCDVVNISGFFDYGDQPSVYTATCNSGNGGVGDFSCNISGLSPGTQYYNIAGIHAQMDDLDTPEVVYISTDIYSGEELSFTTSDSGGGITDSQNISATINENLTLDCGTSVDLDNGTMLIPGIAQTNITTCAVTTNDEQGYDLQLTNDRGLDNTLYHTVQSGTSDGQVQDKTPWNFTVPNAQTFTGTGLAFGILSSTATKNESWWGTGATCDDTNQFYAGIPHTNTTILEHPIYSNVSTNTDICYQINVPSTQIAGEYTGSVTYTATGRP